MTLYHPPTALAPLQVDEDKNLSDSDHFIVVFAPKSDQNFRVERKKKEVKTRPLPDSKLPYFGREIQEQTWENVIFEEDLDKKVENFHNTIVQICDKHFPSKIVKISNLDKKWITPELKTLSRKVKKEFFFAQKKLFVEKVEKGV